VTRKQCDASVAVHSDFSCRRKFIGGIIILPTITANAIITTPQDQTLNPTLDNERTNYSLTNPWTVLADGCARYTGG
jgi:hypothetical protein